MLQNDEQELRTIFDRNPFRKVICEWKSQIKCFNSGNIKVDDLKFVLPSDESLWMIEYNKKAACHRGDWDARLHLELLPDVFRGDPRAPVWMLLLNPGFSEIDWYDHLGLCPICKKRLVRADGNQTVHPGGCISKWLGSEFDNPAKALASRQDALLDNLNPILDNCQKFFWLDKEFHTMAPNCKALDGHGGHLWWKRNLFGTGRKAKTRYILPECGIAEDSVAVGCKVFAIELFPYHSRNFDKGVIARKKSEYRNSIYLKFWLELVRWAVRTERILIVRSSTVLDYLMEEVGSQCTTVYRQNSWQNAAFTYGNISGVDIGNGVPGNDILCETLSGNGQTGRCQ